MFFRSKLLFIVGICCFFDNATASLIDPVYLGISTLGVFTYNLDFLKDEIYCSFKECCNERGIPADIDGLRNDLSETLFGQHVVQMELIPALEIHFSGKRNSRKPLVISFQGTRGTGKSFVVDQIAKNLYAKGLKSKFVHKYMGRSDFPKADDATLYGQRISREVREAIKACPRSLFIFDNVEKMPDGVFESLTSLMNYNAYADGYDATQSIFIFISNTGGIYISHKLIELEKAGTLREYVKPSHFEQILKKAAYNLDGGLKKSSLMSSYVIDHFTAFLPLNQKHVRQCIQREFKSWNVEPDEDLVESVIDESVIYDETCRLFSISGCKGMDKKVALKVMSR